MTCRRHYALTWPGPADLPFEHEDVRAYVDGLFLEGQLRPVPHGKATSLSGTWAAVGLRTDETADELRRMDRLIEAARKALPDHDDRHDKWFHFAALWAELGALKLALNSEVPDDEWGKIETLRSRVDTAFAEWIEKRYRGLVNLPPVPPVMLHHLPRLLARDVHNFPRTKVALLSARGTRPRVPGCVTAPECGRRLPGRTRLGSRRVAGKLPSAARTRPIGIRSSRPTHRGARWRLNRGAHRPSRQD